MIHSKISLPYKVGSIELLVNVLPCVKTHWNSIFYFFMSSIIRNIRKIYKHTFQKNIMPHSLFQKIETLTGVSIMFLETPTVHIKKIMPICLLNTLLKSN